MGLNNEGIIFLVAAWLSIFTLISYCYWKIFTIKK